ncbi:MAG TPA: AAA family ATPase [Pseudolysinimonas sp.]
MKPEPGVAGTTRVSAALVDRDDVLGHAARRWTESRDGAGQFLLVAGEAGIGKTRILDEVLAVLDGAPVLTTRAWPRDAEFPGAVLYDLARELRQRGMGSAAAVITERLDRRDGTGDDARRHRLLIGDLGEAVLSLLADHPVLLRIEDLHWADELSLAVLGRLAPLIRRTSSMVIASYRTDELVSGSALSTWRAALLQQRFAEEVTLPRLDRSGTLRLTEALLGTVPAAELVDSIHERSNGIPLHIEELIAAGADHGVPDTVGEAVRARAARLDDVVRQIVSAAAVIGCSFEFDLLAAIVDEPEDEVDRALRVLAEQHLMVALGPTKFDFRHALIRDALYEEISPFRKRAVHTAVARASERAGIRRSYLSEQFELAGLPLEAHEHALASARDASRMSAHREAAELYARALRTAPEDATLAELSFINFRFGVELAAVDRNEEAAERFEVAIDQLRAEGRIDEAASTVSYLMFTRHLLGDPLETRIKLADEAISWLDAQPDGGSDVARASVLGAVAAAYLMADALDEALEVARRASALVPIVTPKNCDHLDIQTTLGGVLVFSGDLDQGWKVLEEVIADAEGSEKEAEAVRARRMLASAASALVDYPRANAALDEALRFTAGLERWNDHHYLRAHRAHVRWATGASGAERDARRALADGRGITTEIQAHISLGYVHLSRGEFDQARDQLMAALELAEPMGELQRISPAVWGLAELALREDRFQDAVELCERGYRLSAEVGDAAYLFSYVLTGTRAYLAGRDVPAAREWIDRCAVLLRRRGIPGTLPALDHAMGLLHLADGRVSHARESLVAASDAWDAFGRFWEGTLVLIDLARTSARGRRVGEATRYVSEARRRAGEAGAKLLVRLADEIKLDPAADAASGPLTAREFEVARLIAEGATNREIADRLVIAPKTASAHVEHILAKLGVSRRAEIAAWVSRS